MRLTAVIALAAQLLWSQRFCAAAQHTTSSVSCCAEHNAINKKIRCPSQDRPSRGSPIRSLALFFAKHRGQHCKLNLFPRTHGLAWLSGWYCSLGVFLITYSPTMNHHILKITIYLPTLNQSNQFFAYSVLDFRLPTPCKWDFTLLGCYAV